MGRCISILIPQWFLFHRSCPCIHPAQVGHTEVVDCIFIFFHFVFDSPLLYHVSGTHLYAPIQISILHWWHLVNPARILLVCKCWWRRKGYHRHQHCISENWLGTFPTPRLYNGPYTRALRRTWDRTNDILIFFSLPLFFIVFVRKTRFLYLFFLDYARSQSSEEKRGIIMKMILYIENTCTREGTAR